MSDLLQSLVGGGGGFVSRTADGDVLALGATAGVVLTITPPLNQRVRLTHLSTFAGQQPNLSVVFGSTTVIGPKTLYGLQPRLPASFSVGNYQEYAAGAPPNGNFPFFTGDVNEALTIVTAASTTQDIYYGYEFGE